MSLKFSKYINSYQKYFFIKQCITNSTKCLRLELMNDQILKLDTFLFLLPPKCPWNIDEDGVWGSLSLSLASYLNHVKRNALCVCVFFWHLFLHSMREMGLEQRKIKESLLEYQCVILLKITKPSHLPLCNCTWIGLKLHGHLEF